MSPRRFHGPFHGRNRGAPEFSFPKMLYLLGKFGAPGEIRTHDLCLRRAALYPAELRVLDALAASGIKCKNLAVYLIDCRVAISRQARYMTAFLAYASGWCNRKAQAFDVLVYIEDTIGWAGHKHRLTDAIGRGLPDTERRGLTGLVSTC